MVGTHKLSDSADHFTDIVEALPESLRWQLLQLSYDIEKTDTIKSALASIGEFSNSSSRLAASTEKLPEQLRQQLSILIEQIDTKQTNLRDTIDRMRALVADIDAMTLDINLRIAILIAFIFVLALIYRIITVRYL